MRVSSAPLSRLVILCGLVFVTPMSQVFAFSETDSLTADTPSERILKALNSGIVADGTTFTEVASLTGVVYGDMEWGDYDNDNDLDLVVTGSIEDPNVGSMGFAKLYKNNEGVFSEDTGNALAQLSSGSVAWGDYDNDGDIDLMLTGNYSLENHATLVYNNNNGVLTELPGTTMPGVVRGGCNWVDIDNDGDLDIFIYGWTSLAPGTGTYMNRFYQNSFGIFDPITYNVYTSQDGEYAFNDFDGDMDFDVLVTGGDNAFVFFNDLPGSFELARAYDGLRNSSVVWADFDGDGDQDVIVSGQVNNVDAGVILFYKNDGGEMTLVDDDTGIDGHYASSMTAGDYDNDGDLDVLLTGFQAPYSSMNTNLFTNDGTGHFSLATSTGLTTPVRDGDAKWGDIDNDGDLDLIVIGANSSWSERYAKIYTNETNVANDAPGTPTNLKMVQTGNDMVFSWDAATDAQGARVTYNLRIGTSPGGNQVMSSNSDGATGFHRIAEPGNVHNSLSWKIKNLGGLNYYWSVQAIDNSLKAGNFAAEQMTTTLYPPGNFQADAGDQEVTLSWLNGNENGYNIIYRETTETSNPTHVIVASTTATSYTDTDVQNGTTYYYYIKAADSNGGTTVARGAVATPELRLFSEVASFSVSQYGASAWGDYDGDGDYDVVVTGDGFPDPSYLKLYNNANGTFDEVIVAPLTSGGLAYASFIDYDNDNDLDLLHTGNGEPSTDLFRNTGGAFSVLTNTNLPVGEGNEHAWADIDNDGDFDLAVPGNENKIFVRNSKTDFSSAGELPASLSLAWGDYDNDGDMDYATREGIFSNANGIFTKVASIGYGIVEWADIDNDLDLDLVTSGVSTGASGKAVIYRNDGATFTAVDQTEIPVLFAGGIGGASISPGDFDNDGDLDLLVTGGTGGSPYSTFAAIYVNNGSGTYAKYDGFDLPQAVSRSAAWGDYDRDGDLDILFYGWDFGKLKWYNKIYRNDLNVANTAPSVPSNLQATVSDSRITFSWDSSTDTQGGPITYNLRVGTTPGGSEVMSAMANTTTGQLLLPQMGNVQLNRSWTLNGITAGDYYWSVQAVDGSYVASVFAGEKHIVLAPQIITFDAFDDIIVSQAPFSINASASSGLPLTFTSSDPAVATVSGDQITIVSAGTTEITAAQAGNNDFAAAAPVTRVLTVVKMDQTITFSQPGAVTLGDAAFSLGATASSGLPVEFSTTSDKVTLSGNTLTLVKAGSVTITADQPGNESYNAATPQSQSFCINPAKPSISVSGNHSVGILLTSTATAGNQWYLDGSPIAGATGATLTPSSEGNYSVKVTVDDCSSAMSDQIPFVVTGIEEASDAAIRVYPNPATSRLTIELPSDGALRTLGVVHSDGRPALQILETTKPVVELDVHDLPPGLYIINVQRLLKTEHRKFVKR